MTNFKVAFPSLLTNLIWSFL